MRNLPCEFVPCGSNFAIGECDRADSQTLIAQIDRVLFVPLGGIDQWISIRGENHSNPVLLVIHGGPGEAQWPQAELYRPWEKAFIVVQWDQRGAGHTFGRYGVNTSDVTLDRISKDGAELAEYLCRELGKKKIIVLGHSWGRSLPPAWCRCAPISSLPTLGRARPQAGRRWSTSNTICSWLKRTKDGNQATVKELEAIGRPGPTNGDHWSFLGKYNFRSLWPPSDQE